MALISNILDISKFEAGKFELNPERTQYRKMLWKIIQSNKANAVRKGIVLQMSNEASIPKYLLLDPTRLLQVLMNFTSNSIKFTQEGEVSIDSQ